MNKIATTSIAVLGLMVSSAYVNADEQNYIPWTWDEFDANCEVIETGVAKKSVYVQEIAYVIDDRDAGELGW